MTAFCLIVCLLAPVAAAAQFLTDEFPRAQSLFVLGQRLMRERNYPAAIETFDELVRGFKNSRHRDIYHYSLARAYYFSGDFQEASQTLANFHTLFPGSRLRPYAYHLIANSEYRQAKLESAFKTYIRAFETAEDNRLRNLAERSLLGMVESGFLPSDSLITLVPGDLFCKVKARAAFLVTGIWSQERIDEFMAGCPGSSIKKEKTPVTDEDRITIGVILPLTGPYARYGQSILEGAMLAASLRRGEAFEIELSVFDSRADNVTAARQALSLAETGADIIIGPLLSNVAATVASALSCSNIPLLVPAATQAGFTQLSPNCFQMSANMETIGRGMAQYAVKHRGMTTLAVISPTTIDEMTMGEAFAEEAKRLGAHVLAVEKFRPDETDFGPYINDIKEALLGPAEDSAFYLTLDGDTLQASEMPVSFDGLFVPATEQQLFLLLPQINFYRVTTSYLGADEWHTGKVLKLGEKVLKDAVFYSTKGAMHHSAGYDKFSAAYDARYAAEPDRLVAAGYDAVNMLADAVRAGRSTAGDIAGYLRALSGYEGASGRVTFGKNRSNRELPLFTLREDQVRPLIEPPKVEEIPEEEKSPDSTVVEHIKYEY